MPNENKLIVRSNIIVLVIVAVIGMMLFFVNDPYGLKLILLLACINLGEAFCFSEQNRNRQDCISAVGI